MLSHLLLGGGGGEGGRGKGHAATRAARNSIMADDDAVGSLEVCTLTRECCSGDGSRGRGEGEGRGGGGACISLFIELSYWTVVFSWWMVALLL